MLKENLESFELDLELNEDSKYMDLQEYLNLYNLSEAREKKECLNKLCNVLWKICIQFKCTEEELLKIGMDGMFLEVVEDLAAQLADPLVKESMEQKRGFYDEKGIAFVLFLRNLANFEDHYTQNKERFMEFYVKLNDVMQNIKWIFKLKKSDKKIFPIHRLLDSVITDFTPDEEHFLQLVFSLQIFTKVESLSESKDTKDEILKIAKDFNVEILNMLCNGGELLMLETSRISSARNGTLIAVNGDSILIRNTDERYFDDKVIPQQECNADKIPIAYFTIEKLKPNCTLTSFENVMKSNNFLCKQQLLEAIIEQKQYNIFLPDMILIDQDTGSFEGFLNIYGYNDSYIIVPENKNEILNFDMFLKVIATSSDGIRSAPVKISSDCKNIITLDFITEFYRDIVKESNPIYMNKLQSFSNDDFYQNQMFKEHFDLIKKNGQIDKEIDKYFLFVSSHLNYIKINEMDSINKRPKLIMPYEIFVPLGSEEDELYKYLLSNNYISSAEKYTLEELSLNGLYGNKYKYSIGKLDVSKAKFYDFSENEITDLPKKKCKVLFSSELNQVFLLSEYNTTINKLKELNELKNMSVLKKDFLKKHSRIGKIAILIKNISFDEMVYKHYGAKWNCCNNIYIVYFKLFWHLQIYGLIEGRYELFEKLILDMYYTKFALKAEKMIEKYINDVRKSSENNCIIVAKESSGDATTLTTIIDKNYCGEREPIKMAFSSEKLAEKITFNKNEKKYYFLGKEIKKIIFLTDNILSGKSTNDMLEYYLKDSNTTSKRTFLKLPDTKKINRIFETNHPQVSIQTIVCSEIGKKKLVNDWSEEGLTINEQDLIPERSFHWTQEVEDIICELYGDENRKPRKERYQCIFRPYNLPHEDIIPNHLKDTSKLIGIFKRKEEV